MKKEQTLKEISQRLPKTIILEAERRKADEAARKALQVAQNSYRELQKIEDLGDVPDPRECTKEWLEQIFLRKKEAVRSADFMTSEQKRSQLAHLGKFQKRTSGFVEALQRFINSIPSEQYVYDQNIETFYYKNITSLVLGRCVRTVPDEASTHLQLISKASNAISELREWEKAQDLKKYRLEELFRMTGEELAARWATNDVKLDHSHDHLPGMTAARILAENNYL